MLRIQRLSVQTNQAWAILHRTTAEEREGNPKAPSAQIPLVAVIRAGTVYPPRFSAVSNCPSEGSVAEQTAERAEGDSEAGSARARLRACVAVTRNLWT